MCNQSRNKNLYTYYGNCSDENERPVQRLEGTSHTQPSGTTPRVVAVHIFFGTTLFDTFRFTWSDASAVACARRLARCALSKSVHTTLHSRRLAICMKSANALQWNQMQSAGCCKLAHMSMALNAAMHSQLHGLRCIVSVAK